MSDTQAELHDYLKAKNLNAIFVSIVEAILVEKPDNPIGFMTKFLLVRKRRIPLSLSSLTAQRVSLFSIFALGQVSR
jgi:hypothetical protein